LPGALAWSVAFARRFAARCGAGRAVARVRVARRRGAAPRVASIGGGADDLVALHARSGVEVRHPRVERAGVPTSSARNPTLSVCRRSNASERSGMRGWQRPLHASASESCVRTVAAAAKTDALDALPRLRRQIGRLRSLGVNGSELKQMPASGGLGCGHERGPARASEVARLWWHAERPDVALEPDLAGSVEDEVFWGDGEADDLAFDVDDEVKAGVERGGDDVEPVVALSDVVS
jgi:hypothetical protein